MRGDGGGSRGGYPRRLGLRGEDAGDDDGVGCQDGSPFVTNVVAGIKGDGRVSRQGSRSVVKIFDANRGGKAMPGWTGQAEDSSGRRRCTRHWVHHRRRRRSRDRVRSRPKGPEDHHERQRTASCQKGRGSKGIGRRGPPLSVGELAVSYASRGAEVDHDLW